MGKAVAAALGVEPCFVTPSWTEITGGNWADRWDVSWGSGAINADRMTRLYMTQPYYSTPQRFFVRADSAFQTPSDLNGKAIGACASCTHEYYLKGELRIPGVELTQKVADPKVIAYQTEPSGLEDVANGSIDAFLCAEPVGQQAIDDKLALRALDEAAFPIYSTGFVDRASGLDVTLFLDRVNGIIRGLHTDGTLKAKSIEYFGVDYATAAGAFDLESIGQVVP
jgi:polar amino acid transport system substrate-binding protein